MAQLLPDVGFAVAAAFGLASFWRTVLPTDFFLTSAVSVSFVRPVAPLVPELVFFGGGMADPVEKQKGDDYRDAKPEFLTEIIRQGELRLASQLQAALAADARGGWMASVGAAASAALIALASQDTITGANEVAAYGSAIALGTSAALAAWGARPVSFDFAGLRPEDNRPSIGDAAWPPHRTKAAYAEYLDEYISSNAAFMATNAGWTRAAMFAAITAPLIAGIALVLPLIKL